MMSISPTSIRSRSFPQMVRSGIHKPHRRLSLVEQKASHGAKRSTRRTANKKSSASADILSFKPSEDV